VAAFAGLRAPATVTPGEAGKAFSIRSPRTITATGPQQLGGSKLLERQVLRDLMGRTRRSGYLFKSLEKVLGRTFYFRS